MKPSFKSIKQPDIYYADLKLKKDTQYFLFIGSLRNYGPNIFLTQALSKIYGCKFDFIAIIQDVLAHYSYQNMIVINPLVHELSAQEGRAVSCRIPTNTFLSSVSQSPYVHELVGRLLGRQQKLYISMYQSLPAMQLDRIPGVSILGPDSAISDRLNSKAYQYETCKNLVPMVDYRVCNGLDELLEITDTLWDSWTAGIFVSKEYSAGGLQNIVAHGPEDITGKFVDQKQTYLISRYIPHEYDPTVLGVVANQNEIYLVGVADQFIELGTRFVGSTFPTVLDRETVSELKKYTRMIGQWLSREGFRGIFGCDYVIDADSRIFFVEANARQQGTTMEFCCTLENALPSGAAMLPELQYYAVMHNRFPDNTIEMAQDASTIHWGTYNYKNLNPIYTHSHIPQHIQERQAFKEIAENRLKKDVLILEHIGSDLMVTGGSFLARIVALGPDHLSVQQCLNQGKKTIERTFKEQSVLP
jgi:hypothetical protein